MHQQLQAELLRGVVVAKLDHLAKLPGGVDVQQRKRRFAGMERLHRQVQQHRRVLADRIQHDRLAEFGRDLAHDRDAFSLELLQMAGGAGLDGVEVGERRRGREIQQPGHAATPTLSSNRRAEVPGSRPRSRTQDSTEAR